MRPFNDKGKQFTPLVSVIIPTYNRAHLVTKSIDSVQRQTFKDYEIIVVDDGGNDNTSELLQLRYGKRIVYIRKHRNQGLSAARNTGVGAARGEYIAFLDDDDQWLPEKLEMQLALMQKNPSLGLAYCNAHLVNESNELIKEVQGSKRGYIYDDMLASNHFGISSVLLRKKVFLETGYYDESLSALEDWDLWIRVSKFYDVDFVDQPLVRYLMHSNNMSSNLLNMERSTFAVLDKHWSTICTDKKDEQKRNVVYSSHCVNFAWKQYFFGDTTAFRRLIMKALQYDPLHCVIVPGGKDMRIREKALFESFNTFWHERNEFGTIARKKTFASHYMQLAWEYYHQADMSDFRRCLCLACCHSFPKITLRLIVPFFKSFMGKGIADGIHGVRKIFMSAWQ
jgi:glycosyltransferase involved in cell wall biosynthesis